MNNSDFKQVKSELEEAWEWVTREFPFSGYIRPARKESYFEMPKAISKWIAKGSPILDFGAGPCDKTSLLSLIGYKITAFDDMGDEWFNFGDNRRKILNYAEKTGIQYVLPNANNSFTFPHNHYDAIVLNNVIEHLHESPRHLLNCLLSYLKSNGYLFIAVPNAANLRKRISLLFGKTNYSAFDYYYWSPGVWRGHIREYVKKDLILLAHFLGLKIVELSTHHYHLEVLPKKLRWFFVGLCKLSPGLRESWMLVAQKPSYWNPRFKPTHKVFYRAFGRQYYTYDYKAMEKRYADGESDM